ncbi:DUF2852 domain-containing protein [Pseudogemmobacter bohemicus]|uniref:DUF2852 domain-containing protein n=1 Tax=Pseudogemmobacter bohemicus TaxID=2250708 RepID=UPI000DD46C76|nr:DUF2852 domain-containing protein [Pseudogemmobacter bohemicus]
MAFRGFTDRLRQADAWLDARGKWAWIAAMVAGFVIFFPLGLALLAWMIWGKQMFGFACSNRGHERGARHDFGRHGGHHRGFRATGNTAFDSYRNETLRRLEEEQGAFESFLQRLRDARDKQEFDRFMDERARVVTEPTAATETATGTEPGDQSRRGEY